MDQKGTDKEAVLASLKERLDPAIVDFTGISGYGEILDFGNVSSDGSGSGMTVDSFARSSSGNERSGEEIFEEKTKNLRHF